MFLFFSQSGAHLCAADFSATASPQTNHAQTSNLWATNSGQFPTDLGVPPLRNKNLPEPNPPKVPDSWFADWPQGFLCQDLPGAEFLGCVYIYIYIYIHICGVSPDSVRTERLPDLRNRSLKALEKHIQTVVFFIILFFFLFMFVVLLFFIIVLVTQSSLHNFSGLRG